MVAQAISAYAQSPRQADPLWVRGIFTSPAGDVREVRPPFLTAHQRAFQRALYYHRAIYHRSPDKGWSLVVEWQAEAPRVGASRRLFRVRVFRDTSGARHSRGAGRSYVRNPLLRSRAAVQEERA